MKYKDFPETPGVYLMRGKRRKVLYVGKAANLKRRVSSYFLRPHNARIEKLVGEIQSVDYTETDSALEALILESQLIKKYEPPYNVRAKDDTSFLYIEITNDVFPRVLLVRGRRLALSRRMRGEVFGPFTSASDIRQAMRILRRIFPFSIHPSAELRASPSAELRASPSSRRPCLDYELGLCPGVCAHKISKSEYLKNIGGLKLVLRGKKKTLVSKTEREMKRASKELRFEEAGKLRRQIFALQHIQDIALIRESEIRGQEAGRIEGPALSRIEGYDVSNISGTSAVGAMVVFYGTWPERDEYRRFRIRTVRRQDDTGMLQEVMRRRLQHTDDWSLPGLVLVDGGKGQVNAVREILDEHGLAVPVVGIAKGARRKKNELIGEIPKGIEKNTLIRVRDEAHRFALLYHKKVRGRNVLS